MEFKTLILKKENGIMELVLNRPEEGNAFNKDMFFEFEDAIEACDKDDEVKVIIITGAGKHFSVGGDIGEMAKGGFIGFDLGLYAARSIASVRRCSKPVIAMINGAAAGAGCALALACDFRIFTERGSLLTAFSNVGLSGDCACLYHLYQHVGLAKTIEMMALSEPIRIDEIKHLNLATKVVPVEDLREETFAFANKVLGRPLVAVAMQKKIYNEMFYGDFEQYCRLEAEMLEITGNTEDHLQAVTAFLEKRKPVFNHR